MYGAGACLLLGHARVVPARVGVMCVVARAGVCCVGGRVLMFVGRVLHVEERVTWVLRGCFFRACVIAWACVFVVPGCACVCVSPRLLHDGRVCFSWRGECCVGTWMIMLLSEARMLREKTLKNHGKFFETLGKVF